MGGEGNSLAGKNRCPRQREFEIRSWPETYFLAMNHRLRIQSRTERPDYSCVSLHKVVSIHLAKEGFKSHGPQPRQKAWQSKWRYTIHAEHVNRFRVVAPEHGAARSWAPPQALFSK